MKPCVNIFWFRRDLRLEDNAGLFHALSSEYEVLPIFIFDRNILEKLEDPYDRRVDYIHQSLNEINQQLKSNGSSLKTYFGYPLDVFSSILEVYNVKEVFCNRDYEPLAIERDRLIEGFLRERDVAFHAFKDQVIFDTSEVVKPDGQPYTVYTPYAKKWREQLFAEHYRSYPIYLSNFYKHPFSEIHSLHEIGFTKTDLKFKLPLIDVEILQYYKQSRDIPSKQGTSGLSMALRFGTISIRKCVAIGIIQSQFWLSELIWREFFMQILFHFPEVVHRPFKPKYDFIKWRNDESEFEKWCNGKTGYPIVDAGMRELNATGFMQNRVRMIVASFLCKHLLIDWRWGEAYFAQKLNDYDLAANNGNWQWIAGCGCDAAPYFRVFNPYLQTEKFDKDLEYIKKWIPELATKEYPEPCIDHDVARLRAIKVYKEAFT